jgi:alkaline phosphatase D
MTHLRYIIALVLATHVAEMRADSRRAQWSVHQATGIKIGEVTPRSVIIWTRVTRFAEQNFAGPEFVGQASLHPVAQSQLVAGVAIDEMRGAVPGSPGQVCVTVTPSGGGSEQHSSGWLAVDPERDFTRQIRFEHLRPDVRYAVLVESRSFDGAPGEHVEGAFKTAPLPEDVGRVRFAVVTCQDDWRREHTRNGFKAFVHLRSWSPDFVVHTGDLLYLDQTSPYATRVDLARFKWRRAFAYHWNRELYRSCAFYFQKDDHDIGVDDTWPGRNYGDLTWDQGLALNREQLPWPDTPYRTHRWGRDIQIWLTEGREYRSPNTAPDGPEKSIWGRTQREWLFQSLRDSDATFRILISPTPIVGPDLARKRDNHANAAFAHEGDIVRRFLAGQRNVFVICGDRHWQYHSVDTMTGLHEFGCGPLSDRMVPPNFPPDFPPSLFRALKGGFLTLEASRDSGRPALLVRYHDTDGRPGYHYQFAGTVSSE